MKGFHKRSPVITPNFWDAFFRSPLQANQIELNPTWRQNIRKELQLTNTYNVQFWERSSISSLIFKIFVFIVKRRMNNNKNMKVKI